MLKQFLLSQIPAAYAAATNAAALAKTNPQTTALTDVQGTSGLSDLAGIISDHFLYWVIGIVIIVFAFSIAKTASRAVKERIIKNKGEEIAENTLVLVERMTRIGVILVGAIIAASINGINLTAIVGAASLGIGFALKDIIGNFISSMVMLAQGRIRIGDMVQIGDTMGTIVSIDTRVTIIQNLDGNEVVIPNQTMLNSTLISYTTNPFRRLQVDVGVDYKTDLGKATSLVKAILENDSDLVAKPAPNVFIGGFGESSILLQCYFWIESTGKSPFIVRSNVAHRIKKAFDEASISIPCPIRVLKLDEDDRALLQTMDSMKKGIVPAPKEPITEETLKAIAAKTKNERIVPHPLAREEEKKATIAPTVPPTQINPKKDYESVSPPPTHL
ncbi:mechanosensitive ion channel [Candidatus Peregrinibacteria bacterium]|nr:mechanosensitive ion channel [Candidatus Peregrinibacteria bacterium]